MEGDMTKQLLAGAAVFALLAGTALAQGVSETTTSRTTVTPAPVEGYSATRTERNSFGGASIETEKSVKSDGMGGVVSSQKEQVVRPDGSSETRTHKEWSAAPVPPASSSTTTTTTINR
jgi:hypothetical protein